MVLEQRHYAINTLTCLQGILFLGAAAYMRDCEANDWGSIAKAFERGCKDVSDIGGAKEGDCTMLGGYTHTD